METEERGSVQQICENLELVKGFAIVYLLILFELTLLKAWRGSRSPALKKTNSATVHFTTFWAF